MTLYDPFSKQVKKESLRTISARSGLNSDTQHGAVIPKISLSTCYRFAEFGTPRQYDYGRKSTPNRSSVEQTIAELEGGADAILTNSGMSAVHLLSVALLSPDDLVIVPHDCYGGSYRLFNSLSQKGYFKAQFIDLTDITNLQRVLQQKPKLILIETPSNPLLRVVDIAKISQLAHKAGTIVLVDNTFMTPILQNPFEFGADIILHSCTKFLNGHSDLLAGVLVFKEQGLANEVLWWSNNIGTANSSLDAYLLQRGLRTLAVRVQNQQLSALKIVDYLSQHPRVITVHHPSLPSTEGHDIAKKQQKGFGSLLSFEIRGKPYRTAQFVEQLKYFTLAQSLGGIESLISHPATMTHSGISAAAREAAGISDQLLRISVGLEDVDDLIGDLGQALAYIW